MDPADTAPFADVEENERAPREACGLFGVYGHENAASLIQEGLFALQHRGQEGAGLVVSDGEHIRSVKGLGLLNDVIARAGDDVRTLVGPIGIGHVQYSSAGHARIHNVQPLVGECLDGFWAAAHNGNLVNAAALRRQYQEAGALFQTGTDSEVLLHLLADARHRRHPSRTISALNELRGSFSFLLMNNRQLIAVRDPRGFKPLSLGRLGHAWVAASETCALTRIGAVHERDLRPGEVVTIDENGPQSEYLDERGRSLAQCVFELVYFARPDSLLYGYHVHLVRFAHGARLAREHPVAADCVAPVPDSGNFAALGFSRASGIPIEYAFIRNHYVGRTFIMPGQDHRMAQVDRKLSVLPDSLAGRRIVVVDDSLVRGTTMRRRVKALREAGALEVHLRIASPPVAHPCFYGIDFPTRNELVAATRTIEEIREMVGADSLGYLGVEGLLSPFGGEANRFCRACFTGGYPIAPHGAAGKESAERGAAIPG